MTKSMKKALTLLLIFSFFFANAQYNNGTLFLKDSTSLRGLIKIKTFGGIKFKSDNDSESIDYDYNKVDGFDLNGKSYRYVKNTNEITPRLLNENIKGKISLYSNEVYNPGHTIPNGFAGGGMSFGGGSSTIYFIKINDELTRIGAKFKNKHLELFSSCPSLTQKIENKEFKKREVYEIVSYFNDNCD